jgi:hypothetical protein
MGYTISLTTGIILLFLSLWFLRQSISFIKKNERAVATVLALEEVRDSDGITYKPVFKFLTADKKEIHFRHFASSSPPAFNVGEEVGVSYDTSDPSKAKILSYFGAFGWSIILMALSMPLLVIGGGYYLSKSILS